MARSVQVLACLVFAAAVPATAQTFGFALGPTQACLSIGDATYRMTAGILGADLTVRIDPAAAAPDIRIQFAETPNDADFIFVDDGDAPLTCSGWRGEFIPISRRNCSCPGVKRICRGSSKECSRTSPAR